MDNKRNTEIDPEKEKIVAQSQTIQLARGSARIQESGEGSFQ